MKQSIMIASRNPGKIFEIREILATIPVNFFTPKELGIDMVVEETGSSYLENAKLKARAYLDASGIAVLADDSGLEVDSLGGKPGIFSARFAEKENPSDADRRAFLLKQLAGKPLPWTAQFHCTAVLALPNGDLHITMGECKGTIIPEERGDTGFGYDPIFFIPKYDATMAELGPVIKNKISHRARAITAMRPILTRLFALSE